MPCHADAVFGASELLGLIKTLETTSRGESRCLKNSVAVHASGLNHVIQGLDVSNIIADVTAVL
jgi:hypothetical protein